MTDTLVLSYHAVSETWPAALSVTPARLEEHVRLLLARGYVATTFTEAVDRPPASRCFAVTFDDAFRSVLDRGLPVLEALGAPATVFAPSDWIGANEPMAWPGIDGWLDGPHRAELLPMSWAELDHLAAAGWEIGSHTRSHPRLTQLGDPDLADELAGSRAECEARLGRPCHSLAYPYGDVDERVVAAAAAAGYRYACSPPRPAGRPRPLLFPRMGVYHDDDARRFRRKASPGVRRLWASPAWPALSRLARKLGRG